MDSYILKPGPHCYIERDREEEEKIIMNECWWVALHTFLIFTIAYIYIRRCGELRAHSLLRGLEGVEGGFEATHTRAQDDDCDAILIDAEGTQVERGPCICDPNPTRVINIHLTWSNEPPFPRNGSLRRLRILSCCVGVSSHTSQKGKCV